MRLQLKTSPTLYPITLAELKAQLNMDTSAYSEQIETLPSLVPATYAVAANYTTYVGTAIEVLGYNAVVNLNSGSVVLVGNGTIDCKIQESDDNTTWTDWTGGAFTQVTSASDFALQEKAYTGIKRYIRTVAQVLVASCNFSTSVIRSSTITAADSLLTEIIYSATDYVEDITNRKLLTQTWECYLDKFPDGDFIRLPFGNLQSITSIIYKDSAGTSTTMTETTDYIVEKNGDDIGRIVLPYGDSWPSFTAWPSNPITIKFVCGWITASSIPSKIKAALKMIATDLFVNREWQMASNSSGVYGTFSENKIVKNFLCNSILSGVF